MKLLTSLTCLVAAIKAFDAGDYISDRIDSALADIYTPLEDGYDIHIGEYIHCRREGNKITNNFAWGFDNTELDWTKETITWDDGSFNYNKLVKVTVDRYPWWKPYYPSEGVTIWKEDHTIKGTFDKSGEVDITVTSIVSKDDDSLTSSHEFSTMINEINQNGMSLTISASGTVESGDGWTEDDLAMMSLNYKSYDANLDVSLGVMCQNSPFAKGCFVQVDVRGSVNNGENNHLNVVYKVPKGGVFVLKAECDKGKHVVKIIGSDKNSMSNSDRLKVLLIMGNKKPKLIVAGPTPWGFVDNCGEKLVAHGDPFVELGETFGDNPMNWLLAFIYADKVVADMPEDLFDLSDISKCANIKSSYMLNFFNNHVRPAINRGLEDYYGMKNMHDQYDPIEKKDSVVAAQTTILAGANNLLQDEIRWAASYVTVARKEVNAITGPEGEEMFNDLWA